MTGQGRPCTRVPSQPPSQGEPPRAFWLRSSGHRPARRGSRKGRTYRDHALDTCASTSAWLNTTFYSLLGSCSGSGVSTRQGANCRSDLTVRRDNYCLPRGAAISELGVASTIQLPLVDFVQHPLSTELLIPFDAPHCLFSAPPRDSPVPSIVFRGAVQDIRLCPGWWSRRRSGPAHPAAREPAPAPAGAAAPRTACAPPGSGKSRSSRRRRPSPRPGPSRA
jgi:hypothetical protein